MNNSHLIMTATNNDIVVYKSKVTYHNTIIVTKMIVMILHNIYHCKN